MPTVKIQISDEHFNNLKTIFGKDMTSDFANAALKEWIAWLDGSRRVMSTTELETERIYTIYQHILTDSIPSAGSIGQIFNLPLGRSQYVVRNLKYKYPQFFRRRKIVLIIQALENGKWSNNRTNCTIEISVECRDLFDKTIKGLKANGKINSEVQGNVVFDNIRYELGSGHHEKLLEEFKNMQNH
jgi:hypothetical protein